MKRPTNHGLRRTPKGGKKSPDEEIDPAEAARLADEAIKQMLRSEPETHDAMVRRGHREGKIKRRRKKL